jgi:hypothetical protein
MLLKLNRLFKLFHLYSNTYEKIQKHSDSVWKNQRYYLISEYYALNLPPFNIIIRSIRYIMKRKNDNGIFIKNLICYKSIIFLIN